MTDYSTLGKLAAFLVRAEEQLELGASVYLQARHEIDHLEGQLRKTERSNAQSLELWRASQRSFEESLERCKLRCLQLENELVLADIPIPHPKESDA